MVGAEGAWDQLDGITVVASLKLDCYIGKL